MLVLELCNLALECLPFSAEISMSPALLLVDAVPSGLSFEPLIRSFGGAGVWETGRASSSESSMVKPNVSVSLSLNELVSYAILVFLNLNGCGLNILISSNHLNLWFAYYTQF